MTAWWQHYRGAFTPAECAAICLGAKEAPVNDGTVGYGGTSRVHDMRRSQVRWIPQPWEDVTWRWVYERIVLRALQVNRNAFHLSLFNEPFLQHGHAQFTEYDEEHAGHYDWHEDNCWITKEHRAADRKLTAVVQLTNPGLYEGGTLELERDNPTGDIFTQQGDLIYFPSHLRHRVMPVTRGTRHSLVLWFEGPPLS